MFGTSYIIFFIIFFEYVYKTHKRFVSPTFGTSDGREQTFRSKRHIVETIYWNALWKEKKYPSITRPKSSYKKIILFLVSTFYPLTSYKSFLSHGIAYCSFHTCPQPSQLTTSTCSYEHDACFFFPNCYEIAIDLALRAGGSYRVYRYIFVGNS